MNKTIVFEMAKSVVSTEIGCKVCNVTKDVVINNAPGMLVKAGEKTVKIAGWSAGLVTGTVAGVVADTAIETGKNFALGVGNGVKAKVNELKEKNIKEVSEGEEA